MRYIEVKKSNELKGEIIIPGAKNSSLSLLTAACLSNDTVIINNVPNISDIDILCDISQDIGISIKRYNNTVEIDPRNITNSTINNEKAEAYRASYYFVGALLAKKKKVVIGYPGGDNFGSRPIDQHIKGLEALGAKFHFKNNHYIVEANNLIGTEVYFDVITSGATLNVMMAAVLAKGKTVLRNAARDPEVVDLAIFLNRMGAQIRGAGTNKIVITGVEKLSGCTHSVIPDRIIAGSLIMAAGMNGGDITLKNVIPEHLLPCNEKLKECGLIIEEGEDYVKVTSNGKISNLDVITGMYPAFATDLQQPLTALLTKAHNHSVITEKVYPNRFKHCIELNKMGADIILRDGKAIIPGRKTLKGAWVEASDVRAGICLILAGLSAKGTTYITGIEHIERGYENIVDVFKSIGADIRISEEEDLENRIMM